MLLHASPLGGFFVVQETPAADATGSLLVPAPLPDDPTLVGAEFVCQLVTFWPGGACGATVSSSRGLAFTIQ